MEVNSTIGEIVSKFRVAGGRRPVLLLGAGASFRSGVPLADEAVRRIARAHYAMQNAGDWELNDSKPDDFLPHLHRQTWYARYRDKHLAECFPAAVENMLTPRAFRREFLLKMIRQKEISIGYAHLANLAYRELCNKTILTTNFDNLIRESLNSLKPGIQSLSEVNRIDQDVQTFDSYSTQIVYLHGAVELYTDRISENETNTNLNGELLTYLWPLLRDVPLIVVGYRGAEATIMKNLLLEGVPRCSEYRHGIWWCVLKGEEPHQNVGLLQKRIGQNLKLVEIEGFDELMKHIDETLEGKSNLSHDAGQLGGFESRNRLDAVGDLTVDDLDKELVRKYVEEYCSRRNLKIEGERLEDFLLNRGILRKVGDLVVPSEQGLLLFGKQISPRFPYAKVLVQISDPVNSETVVVEGNLVEQFERLHAMLMSEELNRSITIKRSVHSEQARAYHPLAIRESLMNLLVHRDYSRREYSRIVIKASESTSFVSPGGLVDEVFEQIRIGEDRTFVPTPGLRGYRNPIVADMFSGVGQMEMAGTGLVHISEFMIENGGAAVFQIAEDNTTVTTSLYRAKRSVENGINVATPILQYENYTTNLLPISVLPRLVFLLRISEESSNQIQHVISALESNTSGKISIFDTRSNPKQLVSFSNPLDEVDLPERVAKLERVAFSRASSQTLLRSKLVWLIGEHMKRHLLSFGGLSVHHSGAGKMAYFVLSGGELEKKVQYMSELGRRTTRTVVKRREGPKGQVFHENEGFSYAVDEVGGQWVVRIKPIYMFTTRDGITPLSGYRRGKLSTRRFKFDRNKNVRDDLMFWSEFLCRGRESVDLGAGGEAALILSRKYIDCEVPA